jgi:hypothetical protein
MAQTDKSLKASNRIPIVSIAITNAIVLYVISQVSQIQLNGIVDLLKYSIGIIPAGIAFAVTSIITELFDDTTKTRLVFWRWADPLPGARAFSELAQRDPRVNIRVLKEKIGEFPTTPRDQNSCWYRLYLTIQGDVRVLDIHRNYLFARDYASLSVLFVIVGGAIGFWIIPQLKIASAYIICLIIQYLVVRQAAKNLGEGFVTTVLALSSNQ